jgi:hypothetical protein
MAVPWLKLLVAGLSPRRSGFHSMSVHVRFTVDRVETSFHYRSVFKFVYTLILTEGKMGEFLKVLENNCYFFNR